MRRLGDQLLKREGRDAETDVVAPARPPVVDYDPKPRRLAPGKRPAVRDPSVPGARRVAASAPPRFGGREHHFEALVELLRSLMVEVAGRRSSR
jgi:hypothetical protein